MPLAFLHRSLVHTLREIGMDLHWHRTFVVMSVLIFVHIEIFIVMFTGSQQLQLLSRTERDLGLFELGGLFVENVLDFPRLTLFDPLRTIMQQSKHLCEFLSFGLDIYEGLMKCFLNYFHLLVILVRVIHLSL